MKMHYPLTDKIEKIKTNLGANNPELLQGFFRELVEMRKNYCEEALQVPDIIAQLQAIVWSRLNEVLPNFLLRFEDVLPVELLPFVNYVKV